MRIKELIDWIIRHILGRSRYAVPPQKDISEVEIIVTPKEFQGHSAGEPIDDLDEVPEIIEEKRERPAVCGEHWEFDRNGILRVENDITSKDLTKIVNYMRQHGKFPSNNREKMNGRPMFREQGFRRADRNSNK